MSQVCLALSLSVSLFPRSPRPPLSLVYTDIHWSSYSASRLSSCVAHAISPLSSWCCCGITACSRVSCSSTHPPVSPKAAAQLTISSGRPISAATNPAVPTGFMQLSSIHPTGLRSYLAAAHRIQHDILRINSDSLATESQTIVAEVRGLRSWHIATTNSKFTLNKTSTRTSEITVTASTRDANGP